MANKKELSDATATEDPKAGAYCSTCERNHEKTFDGPGIGHWKFEIGSDAENQFKFYCSQPTFKLFIPLSPDEKFGSLATPQVNGLKVGIYKGAYVDVPQSLAEIVMESLNQTQRATTDVQLRNPDSGHIKPARLDLQSDADKTKLE